MNTVSAHPQYQAFVDDIIARAPQWMELVLHQCLQNLEQPKSAIVRELPAQQVRYAAELIRVKKQQMAQAFARCLQQEMNAHPSDFLKLDTAPSTEPELLELRLMDENQAEEDIELMRGIQLMESEAEWELRELQTRTATLKGLTVVDRDSNPLRPQTLLRAWAQTLKAFDLTQAARLSLMRCVAEALATQLKQMANEGVKRLESLGVEPAAYRIVGAPNLRAAPELESGFDVTRPGALHELLNATQGKGARAPGAAAPTVGFARLSDANRVEQSLDGLLQRLNQLEASAFRQVGAPAAPSNTDASWPMLTGSAQAPAVSHSGLVNIIHEYEERLAELAQRDSDRRVIGVMGQLFDHVFADPYVPTSVKALIGRLQASALRIALNDPDLFNQHDHPTWSLLNTLASHTMGYADDTDPRLMLFVASVEPVFDAIAQARAPDAQLHAHALMQIHEQITESIVLEQQGAAATLQRLEARESKLMMRNMFQEQVANKLHGVPLSERLRHFLTVHWVHVLVESSLPDYDGEVSATTFWETLKDVLSSLQPTADPEHLRHLLAQLPAMVEHLRAGMDLIGLPPPQQQDVLDEMMQVHQSLIKASRTGSPPPSVGAELTAEQIVQRMREEPPTQASPHAGSAAVDSIMDVNTLDTVPAGLEVKIGDGVEWSKRLSLGAWTQIFNRGGWAAMRLIWKSGSGQYLLFSTPLVDHPLSMTQRALERLAREGLARPLETRSLFERAVDAMMAKSG